MADLFNVFVTAANSSPAQATTTQSTLTSVDPKSQTVIPQESFTSVLTRVVNTATNNTTATATTTTTGTTTTATPTTSATTAAATTTAAGTATTAANDIAGNATQSAVLNQVLLSGGLLAQAGLIVSPVPGLGVQVTETPTAATTTGTGINATTTTSLTGDGKAATVATTTGSASRSVQLQSLLKSSPARTTAVTNSSTSAQADSKANTAANANSTVPLPNDPTVVPTAVNPTAAQALVAASLPTAKTSSIPAQIPLPNVGVVSFDPTPITVNTTQVVEPGAAPGVPSTALATGGQPNLGKDGALLLSEAANQAASRIVQAPTSDGPTFQNTLTETLSNPVPTGTSAAATVNNAVPPAPVASNTIPSASAIPATAASTTITAPTAPNTPVAPAPVVAINTPVQVSSPSTVTPEIAPMQAGTTTAVIAPLAANPAQVGESKSANITGTTAPSRIQLPNANTILPTAVPASTTVASSTAIPVNANPASITVTPPQTPAVSVPAALPTSLAGPPAAIAAPVNGTTIAGTTTLATNLTPTIGGPTIGGLTTGGEWHQKIDDPRDASKDANPLASASFATTTLTPAVTDSSPSTAPAPVSAQIADQVATQMTHLGKDGTVEFRMRLDPPDLGPVKLHLVSSGGELRAEVTVTDNAVKQLIESQLPELRQRLEQSGVTIQRFDVSTDLGAGFGSGGNRGGQTGQQQMANPYPSWSPRAIESSPVVRVASTERGGNRLDVTV